MHSRAGTTFVPWYAQSGLPDHDETRPANYARRLASYISDPSTVRARTIDAFGRAPGIEVIRKMRAEHLETIQQRLAHHNTYGLIKRDRVRLEKRLAQKPAKVAKPKPVAPEPAQPEPLPVAARGFLLHTAQDVIDACADACGVSHGEIIGNIRDAEFIRARNLCAAVLRARGNSFNNIARLLGRREHTSIMHNVRSFFERTIRDERYEAAWMSLAPCVTKSCRSYAELIATAGVRQ